MHFESFFQIKTYLLFSIIFVLIFLLNWLGYLYKKRQLRLYPGRISESMGSIEGSMLGVTSLLMGFSFSVAVQKFEARRHASVEEANLIGNAILRSDLYPDSLRQQFVADLKQYVETRIAYYEERYNEPEIQRQLKLGEEIWMRIWKRATSHANDDKLSVTSLQMIPNLNDMMDELVTRDALRISRVPPLILWTLVILVLIAAFLLGSDYKGHKRNIMLLVGYALVMTMTLNLINELNHPRQGLINLDDVQTKMVELRNLFH
jgi:hypothetical protein